MLGATFGVTDSTQDLWIWKRISKNRHKPTRMDSPMRKHWRVDRMNCWRPVSQPRLPRERTLSRRV